MTEGLEIVIIRFMPAAECDSIFSFSLTCLAVYSALNMSGELDVSIGIPISI